jgi:hypothetical protein
MSEKRHFSNTLKGSNSLKLNNHTVFTNGFLSLASNGLKSETRKLYKESVMTMSGRAKYLAESCASKLKAIDALFEVYEDYDREPCPTIARCWIQDYLDAYKVCWQALNSQSFKSEEELDELVAAFDRLEKVVEQLLGDTLLGCQPESGAWEKFALEYWSDHPDPPPLIANRIFHWKHLESEEDITLDLIWFDKFNKGISQAPRPWMKKPEDDE